MQRFLGINPTASFPSAAPVGSKAFGVAKVEAKTKHGRPEVKRPQSSENRQMRHQQSVQNFAFKPPQHSRQQQTRPTAPPPYQHQRSDPPKTAWGGVSANSVTAHTLSKLSGFIVEGKGKKVVFDD